MTDETKKRIRKNLSDPLQAKIIALNLEIVTLRIEVLELPIYDLTGKKKETRQNKRTENQQLKPLKTLRKCTTFSQPLRLASVGKLKNLPRHRKYFWLYVMANVFSFSLLVFDALISRKFYGAILNPIFGMVPELWRAWFLP
jgi:hypothetical protein